MSKKRLIEIPFNQIFELKRGNVISNEYINNHQGIYPVFSTQVSEPLGYIDSYMYEGKYLIWNTDGLAGYIKVAEGRFSITNIVGIMFLRKPYTQENISLEYIKYILEPFFRVSTKGRLGHSGKNEYTKLNSTMIYELDFKIPFPIKSNGNLDLEKQQEIASKYEAVEIKRTALKSKKEKINSINISFTTNIKTRNYKITDLFTPTLGNGKFTKETCRMITGNYPVYSGNTVSCFGLINEYEYNGEYLTWSKDGLAGYIMYHNEKFSITNHRGILIPTELCKNIDLQYIKIMLEPIFRRYIKGRQGINGKNEYTTLSKQMIIRIEDSIPIPVKDDGSFDLVQQREIASKYTKVDFFKVQICSQIEEILRTNIAIY